MISKNSRARVFISCGQQRQADEVEIARRTAEKLERIGFEPYIGVEEQTLKGMRENTFQRLSESEYLILIHLKQERVPGQIYRDTGKYRGPLISHQVFAIATFLDIESLVFQEEEIEEDEGILKFTQADCFRFTDSRQLSDLVAEKVREKKWSSDWRNQISLERDEKEYVDTPNIGLVEKSFRYYHIKVRNLHHQKIAHDCAMYLEKMKTLSTGEEKGLDLIEFKWKGVTPARIAIPPMKERDIEAFHIRYDKPTMVYFGISQSYVDYTGYVAKYTLTGLGDYELTYILFSENFPPTRQRFLLHIGNRLEETKFI